MSSFPVPQSSIVVQKLLKQSMSNTAALGKMLLHYHEHTHCSLFWLSPTHIVLLPEMLSRAPHVDYSFSQSLWYISQIKTEILKTTCSTSHHLVTCAHHKSNFSFFWTNCKCFGTFMQMIIYNCLLFPTLSIAHVMLIKMYYTGSLLNSLTPGWVLDQNLWLDRQECQEV